MHELTRIRRRSVVVVSLFAGLLGQTLAAQSSTAQSPPQQTPADVSKELEAMRKRIEQLEAEAKEKATPEVKAAEKAAPDANSPGAKPAEAKAESVPQGSSPSELKPSDDAARVAPDQLATASPLPDPTAQDAPAAAPPAAPAAPAVDNDTPFAFADFTWMNSNSRNHDAVLDGKYFSGEFRVDTNYIYDYNHPIDHTLIGTTEGERTGEVVIQALNVGGDFHAGNMQGRLLTQFGAVSTAVPRNDASYSQGQWDLADAYRYFTEAYAGYHLNVNHGLNIQAGVFLSFIGLFSYYSFDNWAYQPSYVSSNTPWFFTGLRAQWFITNKLKIEPWLINGWQSYGKYNGRQGVGGQILWRPNGNTDFVFNTYALGRDTIGNDNRSRYHLDWSQEWKWYEAKDPKQLIKRVAFSLTEDIGCETGGTAGGAPVSCVGGGGAGSKAPSQNFLGAMMYNHVWIGDKFGATIGGGLVNNPGRYLVLLPPINGASATSGTPYFTENPGNVFKAYDWQTTFDYYPSQWVTWRVEFTQRGSNVPYFTGPGGITPQASPGVYENVGAPGSYVPGFVPDLRKRENRILFSLMVKL